MSDIMGVLDEAELAQLRLIEELLADSEERDELLAEIRGRVLQAPPERRLEILCKITDDLRAADRCSIEPCDEFDEPMSQEEFDVWSKDFSKKNDAKHS